jgi:hypothetical protein
MEQATEIENEDGGKALCLIYHDKVNGYCVSDEAVEFLSSIREKVGVIGVAGKY